MLGVSTAMIGAFLMFFSIPLLIGPLGMFYVPFLVGLLEGAGNISCSL
jgi:hypothetical protein